MGLYFISVSVYIFVFLDILSKKSNNSHFLEKKRAVWPMITLNKIYPSSVLAIMNEERNVVTILNLCPNSPLP